MAARKTAEQKKEELKLKIEDAKTKVAKHTEQINTWQKQIDEIEMFEVHSMIKEYSIPLAEMKSLLKEMCAQKAKV